MKSAHSNPEEEGKNVKRVKDKFIYIFLTFYLSQGWHRLEKYLNLEGFLEKSLKIKYALKSTRNSCKGLEKSLNYSIFCRN